MSGQNYRTTIQDSSNPRYTNRILIGVASTGLFRAEWMQARYGQMIPVNWSQVEMFQFVNSFIPLRYQVDDAQNLIVKVAIEKDFEWLLLYEHDVLPPPDAFIKLNDYMRDCEVPVVSGLYFTRSIPSEPLIFRGRGNGAFNKFKLGEKVYADGVPTGFLLIHSSILRAMWEDSPAYDLPSFDGSITVRKVFNTPRDLWVDPEQATWFHTTSGTSDLEWCSRVIEGDYLRKAGWGAYLDRLPDPQYPFLVDTNLFCRHINPDGSQFPPPPVVARYAPPAELPALGVNVSDGLTMKDKPQ